MGKPLFAKKWPRRLAIGASCSAAVFFVLYFFVRPAANRALCARQLSAIGQTLLLYASDNRGNLPPPRPIFPLSLYSGRAPPVPFL
jgi:hypothetical protein